MEMEELPLLHTLSSLVLRTFAEESAKNARDFFPTKRIFIVGGGRGNGGLRGWKKAKEGPGKGENEGTE
jgi:hypothetical protein